MSRWSIRQGDALTRLREIPDASVDALVCDPPAGISFMGKSWDGDRGGRDRWIAWLAEVMEEALRVCKPGAHALVWAIPRTSHWTAMALEDAGWEVRDRIAHHFGSGFPKSHDVSRAIDKAAGAEREVVGPPTRHGGGTNSVYAQDEWSRENQATMGARTAPATPEAARWQGFGTALKPATEDWWLCRKPLAGTVAETVLGHGTGALNINACRIDAGDEVIDREEEFDAAVTEAHEGYKRPGRSAYTHKPKQRSGPAQAQGRWPANVVLSHHEDCVQVGTKAVASDGHYPARRGVGGVSTNGHAGQDGLTERAAGTEAAEAWQCVPGCPVAELDAQSGFLTSGFMAAGTEREGLGYRGGLGNRVRSDTHGDAGGASRFFYSAKPSRAERDTGVEHLPDVEGGFRSETSGQHLTRRDGGDPAPVKNGHPTVKGIALMRYLIRLVTPPGGTVLDCFAGSGTTGCAAVLDGFHFIGVEREPEYVEIAKARITFWAQHEGREVDDVLGQVAAARREVKAHADSGQETLDLGAAA